jgi:hypothetical protein
MRVLSFFYSIIGYTYLFGITHVNELKGTYSRIKNDKTRVLMATVYGDTYHILVQLNGKFQSFEINYHSILVKEIGKVVVILNVKDVL